MSSLECIKTELAAAIARGVKQCVVVGSRPALREALQGSGHESLRIFAVEENGPSLSPATLVPAEFASEPLGTALEKSDFDNRKVSLFVWLGDAGYRTMDAVISGLAFIGSLPKGSSLLIDYAAKRTSLGSFRHTALDVLASKICSASGIEYLIQPQAVTAMLRGLGFQQVAELAQEESLGCGKRLVRALV